MNFIDLTTSDRRVIKPTEPGEYIYFIYNKSNDYSIEIDSSNVSVNFFGLFIGKDQNNFKISIKQHHKATNSSSRTNIKSVLMDASQLTYDGIIRIEKKASKVEAYQTNQNLLLSNLANVVAIPSLEILNKDVKCSHSSSTSEPTRESLMYLANRGLSNDKAIQLYTRGMAKGTFDTIFKLVEIKSPEKSDHVRKILSKYKKSIEAI